MSALTSNVRVSFTPDELRALDRIVEHFVRARAHDINERGSREDRRLLWAVSLTVREAVELLDKAGA